MRGLFLEGWLLDYLLVRLFVLVSSPRHFKLALLLLIGLPILNLVVVVGGDWLKRLDTRGLVKSEVGFVQAWKVFI